MNHDELKTVTYVGPPLDMQHVRGLHRAALPGGTIHDPDPAAVERLHALLDHEQRRAEKEARQGRAAYDRGDLLTNHRRAAQRVNDARRKVMTPEQIAEAVRLHDEERLSWEKVARRLGMCETTMQPQLKAARRRTMTGER